MGDKMVKQADLNKIFSEFGIDGLNQYDLTKLKKAIEQTAYDNKHIKMNTPAQIGANEQLITSTLTGSMGEPRPESPDTTDKPEIQPNPSQQQVETLDLADPMGKGTVVAGKDKKMNKTSLSVKQLMSELPSLKEDVQDKEIWRSYQTFATYSGMELEESIRFFNEFLNDELCESILKKFGAAVARKYKALKAKLAGDKNYMVKVIDGKVKKVKKSAEQKKADEKRSREMKGKKQGKLSASEKKKRAKTREITKRKLGEELEMQEEAQELNEMAHAVLDDQIDQDFEKLNESMDLRLDNNVKVNQVSKTKKFDSELVKKSVEREYEAPNFAQMIKESGIDRSIVAATNLGKTIHQNISVYDMDTDDIELFNTILEGSDEPVKRHQRRPNNVAGVQHIEGSTGMDDLMIFNEAFTGNETEQQPIVENKQIFDVIDTTTPVVMDNSDDDYVASLLKEADELTSF